MPPPWNPPLLAEEAVLIGAVDRDGRAVALVQSLGGAFGSGVVSGRTGLLLGNRGAAATLHAEAGPVLAPWQRPPLDSVPAFMTSREGRVTSLGATAPGAAWTLLQVACRLVRGAGLADALKAPRFAFASAAEEPELGVKVEDAAEPSLLSRLRSAGHVVMPDQTTGLRTAAAVSRLPSGRIEAAVDGNEMGQDGL